MTEFWLIYAACYLISFLVIRRMVRHKFIQKFGSLFMFEKSIQKYRDFWLWDTYAEYKNLVNERKEHALFFNSVSLAMAGMLFFGVALAFLLSYKHSCLKWIPYDNYTLEEVKLKLNKETS